MVRLRELRLAHSMTLEQLAERIAEHGVEVTVQGLSNVECGNKQASDRLLTAWAKALAIDPLLVWHGPLRKPVEPGLPGRKAS